MSFPSQAPSGANPGPLSPRQGDPQGRPQGPSHLPLDPYRIPQPLGYNRTQLSIGGPTQATQGFAQQPCPAFANTTHRRENTIYNGALPLQTAPHTFYHPVSQQAAGINFNYQATPLQLGREHRIYPTHNIEPNVAPTAPTPGPSGLTLPLLTSALVLPSGAPSLPMALPGTAAATAIAPVGVAAAPPTADTDPLQSNSIETERFDWADQPLSFPNLEDPEEEEDGEGETEFAQLAEPEPGDPMNASGLYRTPHLNAWATSFVDVDRGQAVAGIGDQPFAQLPTGPIGTVHRFDGTLNAGVRKTPVAGPSESTTYNLNPAMPTVRHQGFGTLDGTSACIPQPLVANPGVGRSYNPAESTSFARQVNFHESYPGAPWPYHAGATPTVAADMGIVGARVIPTIRPNDAQPSGSQSDTEGGPEPHPLFDIDQLTPEGQQIYRVCTDIAGQINAIRARHPRRNANDIRRFQ